MIGSILDSWVAAAGARGIRIWLKMAEKEKNLGVVAVCDIWKLNREKAAANCKQLFGTDAKQFKYSEEMLKMPELDAVMIATGDFQHAKILAEVVRAGKDCYCEKPMADDVADANWPAKLFFLQNRLCKWAHNG